MRKFMISAAVLALTAASPALAVDTVASSDATAMGTALAGSGFNLTSATLASSSENGFFTNGSAIGINQGVVLTTGSLGCVDNSNSSIQCTGGGIGGSLVLGFTLDSSSLFFNYVFGSEEYNEWVGSSFNDTFQLLLNGPGFVNVNLAQVPGGGGPVSVNNVNNDINSSYYNDNETGIFPIELDGFTDVLTASATGLTPGELYTLSFIIGDLGDAALDSAVFIQSGTIGTDPTPVGAVPEPSTWVMMILGFGAVGMTIRRRRKPKLATAAA